MDILTSIPVRTYGPESTPLLLEDIKAAIATRAHEIFLAHGQPGRDLDDWLEAERELIMESDATITVEGNDVFVDLVLPARRCENVSVHIGSRQLVISSDENRDGKRLFKVIDLPFEIFPGSVEADQSDDIVLISATISRLELR
jgi:Protein of unknown function (DUF2934)